MTGKVPKLKRDWIGRKVRAIRPFSNALGDVAIGTTMIVDGYYRGLRLRREPTADTRVPVEITRVPEWFVELLPEHPDGE